MVEFPVGWAIHQMKNDKEFRASVVAPPGYAIVEFDAAGQEFRFMAIAAEDPVMLDLCRPGEDPHSYMGARCSMGAWEYRPLIQAIKDEVAEATPIRKNGKVANLCCSHSSPILTDRGHVAIQDIRRDDLVWDGVEFVTHDGVAFSGVLPVMTYQGLTLTPEHEVLVNGRWVEFQEAARRGQRIDLACGPTVRIVDGIIRRAGKEGSRKLRDLRMRVRDSVVGFISEFTRGPVNVVPSMRTAPSPRRGRAPCQHDTDRSNPASAGGELVLAVRQPHRWGVPQLRRAWDQMSVLVGQGGSGVCQEGAASPNLRGAGYRSEGQRWALRAGQPTASHAQSEFAEQARQQHSGVEGGIDPDSGVERKSVFANLHDALCGARAFWRRYPAPRRAGGIQQAQGLEDNRWEAPCFDIVNCGPRRRFSANGFIVHNSLQYRTSAPKLRQVARVQYDIPMTVQTSEHIHKVYQRTYSRVPVYWKDQIRLTKSRGWVETFAGRRVQVEGNWERDGWRMGSTAINYRIQGTGADQKYLALAVLKGYMIAMGVRFAWDLHDGIYFYVPLDKVKAFCHEAKRRLDNLPYKRAWDFSPPIPLMWDCKVGNSWGSLKAFEFDN